ncbi:MAG: aminoacyl-tRNA hydrolase [Lachnospiraceae bacterium]|nr:aminoacyl-tRNA hydrolase [Lachnospiraceae bacterium]
MKLIVGLGNPEIKYAFTRHNTGFLAIDELLSRLGNLGLEKDMFDGIFTKTKIDDEDVIIAKPMTYMNSSGDFIKPLADFYKIEAKDIIVVYDELALPVGKVKVTKEGSAAGHNGIKSIIANLGTEKFIKIRIGIKDEKPFISQIDFVLMKYTPEELKAQKENIDRAVDIIFSIIRNGIDKTMNDFNGV